MMNDALLTCWLMPQVRTLLLRLIAPFSKFPSFDHPKVNDLRDAEGKDELKGFGLRAVSADELAAVRQVIGPVPETASHKKY